MPTDVQIKLLEAVKKAYPNAEVIQGISRGDVDDFIKKMKEANETAKKSTLQFDERRVYETAYAL